MVSRIVDSFQRSIAVAALFLCSSTIARAATDKCEELAKLTLADAAIGVAETASPGSFVPADHAATDSESQAFKGMPAFCRVALVLRPSADSGIKVEVWMPASGWNGKFQGQGNGGFAGSIDYFAMALAIRAGYATAGTDTGHTGSDTDARWALGHPEKLIDYGYRAIHEMTVKAKEIIAAYYGRSPRDSYFCSCSNGGREALMEAQRFPTDYNGIIAGASANNWTHNFAAFAWDARALTETSASTIPASKLAAIASGVLAACDGQEGVKDHLLSDPRSCRFDPEVLRCGETENDRCLTQPQIGALKKIYAGAKTSDGQQLYPGFEPGGELGPAGWEHWLLGKTGGRQLEYANSYYENLVLGDPNWDYRTMDFDRDTKLADQRTGTILNATDPNLDAFRKAGGKLIMYHGWSDGAIAPQNTIDYYENVVARMGRRTKGFLRLYMVPGMQHCEGGAGAVTFGQLDDETPDPEHSIYAAVQDWVEKGKLPRRIVATKYENDSGRGSRVLFTRPLCAYPKKPMYRGSGDVNDAKNFSCQ
jgi:Tannase and feruloyl esterase